MDFKLYTDVVLVRGVPEENLQAGDIGTVVERHNVSNREAGYSVEFFDMLGNTLTVVTLSASYLRVPTHADRPTVRVESVAV
jgi:hypothetical protein